MGITAATLSSYAVNETLITQTDQTGNNTVVVSDDIQAITGNNGQVTGTDYVGRLVVINLGGTEQTRRVIADAASTGNTRLLTVGEDWDTNPVGTDTIHIFYNMGDLDGVTAYYNTRTGFYELSNPIIVGNGTDPAGLFVADGELVEIEDSKSATVSSLETQNAGRLQVGYIQGGIPVSGGYITGINNSQGEAWAIFESGAEGRLYDVRFISGLNPLQFNVVASATSDIKADNFSLFQGTDEGLLFDSEWKNGSITGGGSSTELVRVNAGTVFENVVIINTAGLTTPSGDTTTETIELESCIFIGNLDYITLNSNKTWNMVDPSWGVITYSDLTWTTSTANYVNDKRSIKATVQESDGTKLQNALVIVYEGTQLDDLVLELTTDVNGYASDSFTYKAHATNSVTTTYGAHALRVDKWLYTPFAATQVSTEKFNGVVTLITDPNIVQTTQATALSAGSTVTWNEDTNPSELFDFTSGSGTLVDGMIITFTSGAIGTITGLQSGTSVAGEVHLKDRNATAIANGDTFSRTGGAAGTFSGTYTNDTKQPFSIWADGKDLAMQTVHDYFAALTSETTLSATGELVHEWGRASQGRVLYKGGNGFYTERSNLKGIFITNFGAGTISHFTDDSGSTWVPPIQYSFSFTLNPSITGYEWRIYEVTAKGSLAGSVELTGEETASADNQSYAYIYSSDKIIAVQIIDDNYEEEITYYDISNSNQSVTITLTSEDNV